MSWNYNGSVGYKGYASLGKDNPVRLLATGGQISLNQDPLASQGVWGAGYGNAAQIAWAYNYLRLEGNVSYDLTLPPVVGDTRGSGGVWYAVKKFAFTNRTQGEYLQILPDGANGYKGTGFCSGISFNASEGAIVSGDINFQGDAGNSNAGQGVIAGQPIPDVAIQGSTSMIAGDTSLIPYWATGINSNSNAEGKWMDIISWNCSYNADIQLLKCCTAQDLPPLGADYLVLGEMSGDGSFEVFTIADDFKPTKYQGRRNLTIYIADYRNRGGADGLTPTQGGKYMLKIPCALISSGSTSLQTGTSYIQSSFNFTAYGDGTGAPVEMDEADGNGGYDDGGY